MVIKLLNWQKWLFFWLLALLIALGLNYQNRHLTTTNYKITDQRWPAALNGWRIVQLSDLHNQATDGPGNRQILTAVDQLKPDIIAITGDTFDSRKTSIPTNLDLISQLRKIAPVYLIFGNHDFYNDDYIDLIKQAETAGATVLRDQAITIKARQQSITLIGLDDPSAWGGPLPQLISQKITSQKIAQLAGSAGQQLTQPIIILAHRPELWPQYLAIQPIAILAGHTHGGQVRLPLVGALYVPNQKIWPDYDYGYFTTNTSQLIVSRGLGNSSLGQRFNAYPEIVSLDFNHQ